MFTGQQLALAEAMLDACREAGLRIAVAESCTGGLIVIGSFVAEWRAVVEERVPESYPAGLFWLGFLLALGWFLVAERRQRVASSVERSRTPS